MPWEGRASPGSLGMRRSRECCSGRNLRDSLLLSPAGIEQHWDFQELQGEHCPLLARQIPGNLGKKGILALCGPGRGRARRELFLLAPEFPVFPKVGIQGLVCVVKLDSGIQPRGKSGIEPWDLGVVLPQTHPGGMRSRHSHSQRELRRCHGPSSLWNCRSPGAFSTPFAMSRPLGFVRG